MEPSGSMEATSILTVSWSLVVAGSGVMLISGAEGIPLIVKIACVESLRPSVSVAVTTSVCMPGERDYSSHDAVPEEVAPCVDTDVPFKTQSKLMSSG